jgi:hypothetical protein
MRLLPCSVQAEEVRGGVLLIAVRAPSSTGHRARPDLCRLRRALQAVLARPGDVRDELPPQDATPGQVGVAMTTVVIRRRRADVPAPCSVDRNHDRAEADTAGEKPRKTRRQRRGRTDTQTPGRKESRWVGLREAVLGEFRGLGRVDNGDEMRSARGERRVGR